jgi:hypothetical protein
MNHQNRPPTMKILITLFLFLPFAAWAGSAHSSFGVSVTVVHRCSFESNANGVRTVCPSKYTPPHQTAAPRTVSPAAIKRYGMVNGERLVVIAF